MAYAQKPKLHVEIQPRKPEDKYYECSVQVYVRNRSLYQTLVSFYFCVEYEC
jgi:hypothetical protein